MNESATEMVPVYQGNDVSGSKANLIDDPTLKKEVEAVGFCSLFRFADGYDRILMIIGSIAAAANGAALPAFSLLWGSMTDAFGSSTSNADLMVDKAK